jgi:SpoVK/Ycf46/Vps4 family AAA+-type ATPase
MTHQLRRVLTSEDFAVEMLSKEQLLRMRDEVERELEATVGWTAAAQASDSFAPKDFLRRVQTTMLQLERDSAGASAQGMSWNIWVTGASGTGKTKFARLFCRYLRAYGAINKQNIVELTASQLRDGGSPPSEALQQVFAQAAGGVLLIDDAHDLAKSDDSQATVSAAQIQGVLLREMQNWEGHVTVVFAGLKDGLSKLMAAPNMESRVAFHVHIDDYSPAELVVVMEQYAASKSTPGFVFEGGLQEKLLKHLEDGTDMPSGGSVTQAHAIVDRAIQSNQSRMFDRTLRESNVDVPDPALPAAEQPLGKNVLIAADFRIGVKLGAGDEVKHQLDRGVEELIGMHAAKEW